LTAPAPASRPGTTELPLGPHPPGNLKVHPINPPVFTEGKNENKAFSLGFSATDSIRKKAVA